MSRAQPIESADSPGFLASALSAEGRFSDVAAARRWLHERRRAQRCHVERIPFADLRGWRFEPDSGDLIHDSGHFFRVQGVRAQCDFPAALRFEQPIVNQPEIGVLGILAKRFDGVLHFLLQAKMEPGNIDLVQLSPTVQATRSNYTRVHGGKRPRYLDFFLQRGKSIACWWISSSPSRGSSSCASGTGTSSWRPARTSRSMTTSTG